MIVFHWLLANQHILMIYRLKLRLSLILARNRLIHVKSSVTIIISYCSVGLLFLCVAKFHKVRYKVVMYQVLIQLPSNLLDYEEFTLIVWLIPKVGSWQINLKLFFSYFHRIIWWKTKIFHVRLSHIYQRIIKRKVLFSKHCHTYLMVRVNNTPK